jgi:integrase/recombinase XerD
VALGGEKAGRARKNRFNAIEVRRLAYNISPFANPPHQRQRATLSRAPGALFLSASQRNRAQPLSASMWSKIVTGVARRAGCPLFTTHTLRHLRLTHMARAGLDLHLIATYAGHRSVQTTLRYIHLSGVELAEKVTRTMAGIDRMVAEALQ